MQFAIKLPWRLTRSLVPALHIALSATTLHAHDMWLEPGVFSTEIGAIVSVRMRVGQNLDGDPIPYHPALIEQFFIEDATGQHYSIVSRRGAEPAGKTRISAAGLQVIAYRGTRNTVEQDGDKFDAYLLEEGLDDIAVRRAGGKNSGAMVREVFSRCAKSLVFAGSAGAAPGSDHALGLTLELVAERNPYLSNENEAIPFRLHYQGKPLAGTLVVAMNSMNPLQKQRARTDREGRVQFSLHRGGMWLVKAVYMQAAPPEVDAEWESFWASLTFGVPL